MITFENVSKKYKGTQRPALDGVNLQIDRGEFVFIVGASGSGKSSCLQLILREELPTSGSVHVLGQNLKGISTRKVPFFRRNLGTVFQDFRLLQNKNVYDNVAFTLQVIGKSRGFIQEAVPDTLEMVGLAGKGKRFPHELSGGEQQRVAIARAIVNRPAILLADEPTGNLDPATSLGIMQLLRAINAGGTTVVMATHEATFVDIMQQRVVELFEGRVFRDEQSGGYGETASVMIDDLRKAGLRAPLRTDEKTVREVLSPDAEGADKAQAGADPRPDTQPGTGENGASAAASEAAPEVKRPATVRETVSRATEGFDREMLRLAAQGKAPQSKPDASRAGAAAAAGAAAGDENRDDADAPVAPQAPNPEFLKPAADLGDLEETLDPVTWAMRGIADGEGMAERLGLENDSDDDTDIGSVR